MGNENIKFTVGTATPDAHLLGNLMNPNYPKNEMEHCAAREIESLRQQVEILLEQQDRFKSTVAEASAQIILRELEILKLREALEMITTSSKEEYYGICDDGFSVVFTAQKALSTLLTTEHLNEWLKEKIGQHVAWSWYNKISFAYVLGNYKPQFNTFPDDAIDIEPLYAVKEIV